MPERRLRRRIGGIAIGAVVAGLLLSGPAAGSAEPDARAPVNRGSVADRVDLGDRASERAHDVVDSGASEIRTGAVEQGQLTEEYTGRSVAAGGDFSARLRVAPRQPLTLRFKELRPNDEWGAAYGFNVYLDGHLHYVRDSETADPGGGPYSSFFLETADPAILGDGWVEVRVEGVSDEAAYFSEIWAYADLTAMVERQDLRVPDRINFVLGQDYLSDAVLRERLDYVKANIHKSEQVGLGMAVLDYFTVRTPEQLAANYQRYLRLSREYDLPFAIESTADWEGTPTRVPDGKGGFFGDLEYQQILWSPQDQTGPDKDTYASPDGDTQSIADLLGADYDQRYGLSVPNIWGNTPWLTWHHPDLNAYYERKAAESMAQVRPLFWDLQRQGEAWRLLPFSTATESVYWSKRDGVGVADMGYTDHNGGVARRDIYADYNPHTVEAAAADGVRLDPADGLSVAEKNWLYKNQSHHQQLFADAFYAGLPRERIAVSGDELTYPTEMLRHNIHSEIYSRKQEPHFSGVFPSTAQGVVEHARPGAQFITLNDYNEGGFHHLQRLREFGRIANPNLENSVSGHAPDKTLLLRQAYVNGSRYTSPYNWINNPAADWINPFVDDMKPWDVVHDESPTGEINGQQVVSQEFTAGELRLADRMAVRVRRVGAPAPLRLTIYDGSEKEHVVTMRRLSPVEIGNNGWATFEFPIVELERGHTYHAEIEQLGGDRAAYTFPTAGGELLHRVGLDLDAERDRSMVITWRRDASDAIRHVAEEGGPASGAAAKTLAAATRALRDDRYADAYRLAIKADAQRFPALFQTAGGAATLAPFPLTVDSTAALDVDVAAFAADTALSFAVKGYAEDSVSVRVRGFSERDVFVDGERIEVVRNPAGLRFTLDVSSTVREVAVR